MTLERRLIVALGLVALAGTLLFPWNYGWVEVVDSRGVAVSQNLELAPRFIGAATPPRHYRGIKGPEGTRWDLTLAQAAAVLAVLAAMWMLVGESRPLSGLTGGAPEAVRNDDSEDGRAT